jgi:hypothetical protein
MRDARQLEDASPAQLKSAPPGATWEMRSRRSWKMQPRGNPGMRNRHNRKTEEPGKPGTWVTRLDGTIDDPMSCKGTPL